MAQVTRSAVHRVVVVGGGFGGYNAARSLRRERDVDVTLVDRRNHHLFQPLLYQVATGGLSPSDIAAPLRWVLTARHGVRVLLGEARDLDADARELILTDGERVPYDTLVVATGADTSYFGHEAEWARHAPGLKDLEDATRIRADVLSAFERAEREPDEERRSELLTFVVVGGGPTGVELAGALAELARDTLAHDFIRIDPARARIHVIEAGERVLSTFPEELSRAAAGELERLCVEVHTRTMVTDIGPGRVRLRRLDGGEEDRRAGTILWAAGVRASALSSVLQQRAGAQVERGGRVRTGADLALPQRPEILVLGDLAHVDGPDGQPLPALAPVAMQQGRHVAKVVRARLAGRPAPPFRYRDKGALAIVGRSFAVASFRRFRSRGYLAWLLWLFVHLMYLVGFANRLLVLLQWAWSYFTRNRTARLILREPAPEPTTGAPTESASERIGAGSHT